MADGIDTLVTTEKLIEAIRERTDYALAPGVDAEASFIKDSWLKTEIRRSILKLWDFLFQVYGQDFWHDTSTVSFEAGSRDGYLPEDFWRLKRVAYAPSGYDHDFPLKRLTMESSPLTTTPQDWSSRREIRYWLSHQPIGMANQYSVARTIMSVDPIPVNAAEVTIHYVPTPAETTPDPTNGLRFWNLFGHEEFVILDVCIKVKQKDEGNTAEFKESLAQYKLDVQQNAPPADTGQPDTISDVRFMDSDRSAWSFLDR